MPTSNGSSLYGSSSSANGIACYKRFVFAGFEGPVPAPVGGGQRRLQGEHSVRQAQGRDVRVSDRDPQHVERTLRNRSVMIFQI